MSRMNVAERTVGAQRFLFGSQLQGAGILAVRFELRLGMQDPSVGVPATRDHVAACTETRAPTST